MRSSSLEKLGLIAALAGILLVGCASPVGTAARLGSAAGGVPASGAYGARDADVTPETNMMNLNATGELDGLTDEDMQSLDPAAVSDDVSDEGLFGKKKTPEAAKVKTVTKVGLVRSNTDGKFFLQVTKGFLWWKRESSIPLTTPDEATGLKVAAALNKKVMLRGPLQGETVAVKKICKLLDFGQVWDLLSKGSIEGKVYDSRTRVGLPHADITVKSFATGRMSRTKSEEDGSYKIGRLDPGEYEITAWSADFSLGAKDKIAVKKRNSAKAQLGLAPQSQAGTSAPPPVK
jgi:hypothetical protein